jgi:hypothetical protein
VRASLFNHARDNTPQPLEFASWEAFLDQIFDPPFAPHPDPSGALSEEAWAEAKRRLPAWSPASYPSGAKRGKHHVGSVSSFVIDLDDIPTSELAGILDRFSSFEYVIHTSPGAVRCRPGETRLRVIFPLANAVVGSDWDVAWSTLVDALELRGEPWFDSSTCDAGRVYFLPCEGFSWSRNRGAFLDPSPREKLTRKDLVAVANNLKRRKDEKIKGVGRALAAIADGEMYAEHPHRDETMRLVTWHLAIERPSLDVDSVVSLMLPSMTAPGALKDDPDEDRVRRLLTDALEKTDRPGSPVKLNPKRLREAWWPIDRDTPLDFDEIAEVDDHEWVLVYGKSCYLRGPRGYVGPFGWPDGATAALTHLSPAPVPLYKFSANGTVRQKSIPELAETHGRAISGVAVDLNAQVPRFDRDTCVYYEAPCPLREFEPSYDAEVAEWLRLFAGRELERLTRWLFWLTKLDRPSAALFLCGPADTGKSLLATELARLWTSNGVTTLETAIDTFNDSILQCPLVFGDEFVPRDRGDEIKRFVSERDRPIKRKFLPVGRMIGSTRLILAANNLKFADLYGDLTEDDIQAFLDRFVGIDLGYEAIDYLRSVDVGRWVREARIPRFALWVRDNLSFEPQGRFLVRGSEHTKLRTALATRTGTKAIVCEWIAGLISAPRPGLMKADGKIVFAEGKLLLRAPGVRDAWACYSDLPCPRIGLLNQALGAVTHLSRARFAEARFQELNLEVFGSWAEEQNLFSRDELKKKLDEASRTS